MFRVFGDEIEGILPQNGDEGILDLGDLAEEGARAIPVGVSEIPLRLRGCCESCWRRSLRYSRWQATRAIGVIWGGVRAVDLFLRRARRSTMPRVC